MPSEHTFIQERSRYYRIKVFIVTIFIALILTAIVISGFTIFKQAIGSSAPFQVAKTFIFDEIKESSPLGLFYIGFFADLFFNPLPGEAFFIYGLVKGNPIFISLVFFLVGFFAAQAVNYWLGARFSAFFLAIISKSKVYEIRRRVNKLGSYAIFVFNILPLPAPLLSFVLGITKYNRTRFAVYLVLANIIKFAIIIGLFVFARDALLYILKYL